MDTGKREKRLCRLLKISKWKEATVQCWYKGYQNVRRQRIQPRWTRLNNGCYLLLNKNRNGHDAVIKMDQRYISEGTFKFLRSTGPNCSCSICEVVASIIFDVNSMVATEKKPRTTKRNQYTSSSYKKDGANGVVLGSLLLTLNTFHTLFFCFYC